VEDGLLEVTGVYNGPQARPDAPHLWPWWMLQDVEKGAWLDLRNNRCVRACVRACALRAEALWQGSGAAVVCCLGVLARCRLCLPA
jgi:hypothetical protein